jgi:S1-C subfamily serine protease
VVLGGDLITSVNGVDTTKPDEVAKALRALKPKAAIHYELLRGGRPMAVDVLLPESPEIPALPGAKAAK